MDTETLRKQIYDEINAQFESKLRDAKKQKSHVEEELESSTEKWRSERRRLNSEIDRLESALADARNERRKVAGAKANAGPDTPSAAKPPVSDDETTKKAAREWESERTRLENEISRLQGGLAELLERANNPLRAGQSAREQLELRLEEALKMKRQAEDSLLAARDEWDKEKLKLAGEMIKLRRSVGTGRTAKGSDSEDDAQAAEIKRLTAQLAGAREAAAKETADEIERERRATNSTREGLERDLQKARKEILLLKDAQSDDLERQAAHLEEARKAQNRIRDLEQRVAEAKSAGEKEKTQQLEKQLEEAGRKNKELESQLGSIREAAAREYAEQVERERRDAGQARETLERDLKNAQKEVTLLKGAQAADLERQAAQLEESQKAHARIRDLERRIAEAGNGQKGQTDQLEKQLAEAKKAQQDALQLKEDQAEELRGATARLNEAETEIQLLGRRLEETKDRVSTEVVEQLRRQYDERMQEVIHQKTQLSEQLHSASSLLEAERNRFAANVEHSGAQSAQAAQSAQTIDEPVKTPAAGMTIDTTAIDAELARTEARIEDIARLIDDPSTDLSTVIRKNVERAELDAYLKGIQFSMGRGHGL